MRVTRSRIGGQKDKWTLPRCRRAGEKPELLHRGQATVIMGVRDTKIKENIVKFLKSRIAAIILTAALTAMVCSGIALAATFEKSVGISGTVVTANPDLKFYSDSACTQETTEVVLPEVVAGETVQTALFYIKNVGNKNFSQVTFVDTVDDAIGTVTSSFNNMPLIKGASSGTVVTLTTTGATPGGAFTGGGTFTGTYQ